MKRKTWRGSRFFFTLPADVPNQNDQSSWRAGSSYRISFFTISGCPILENWPPLQRRKYKTPTWKSILEDDKKKGQQGCRGHRRSNLEIRKGCDTRFCDKVGTNKNVVLTRINLLAQTIIMVTATSENKQGTMDVIQWTFRILPFHQNEKNSLFGKQKFPEPASREKKFENKF